MDIVVSFYTAEKTIFSCQIEDISLRRNSISLNLKYVEI